MAASTRDVQQGIADNLRPRSGDIHASRHVRGSATDWRQPPTDVRCHPRMVASTCDVQQRIAAAPTAVRRHPRMGPARTTFSSGLPAASGHVWWHHTSAWRIRDGWSATRAHGQLLRLPGHSPAEHRHGAPAVVRGNERRHATGWAPPRIEACGQRPEPGAGNGSPVTASADDWEELWAPPGDERGDGPVWARAHSPPEPQSPPEPRSLPEPLSLFRSLPELRSLLDGTTGDVRAFRYAARLFGLRARGCASGGGTCGAQGLGRVWVEGGTRQRHLFTTGGGRPGFGA